MNCVISEEQCTVTNKQAKRRADDRPKFVNNLLKAVSKIFGSHWNLNFKIHRTFRSNRKAKNR